MYSVTRFKSIFDTDTSNRSEYGSWNEVEAMLLRMSKIPGWKAKKGEYTPKGVFPTPLLSPANYLPDTTRANKNVVSWSSWFALDIDEYDGNFEDIISERFMDYQFICHSTASSTKDHPKFRMILPLTTPVPSDDIRKFWYSANKKFGNVSDVQTKDLSRMFYAPAQYPNAYNFIFKNDGEILDYHKTIASHSSGFIQRSGADSFFDRLPEDVQKQLIEAKKSKLSRNKTWDSYSDCPYLSKKLVDEYKSIAFIDGTGRYRMIYSLMVSMASRAIKDGFYITEADIVRTIRSLDQECSNIYAERNLEMEASRAIEYAYVNAS